MTDRRAVLGVLLALAVVLFLEVPGSWLTDPDETRYAEIAREMAASGDFVTPRLNGAVWAQKPPLLYWLECGAMALFGKDDFVVRLPVRMAAVGTTLLLLFEGLRGPGPWAALAFLACPLGFLLGRFNITDGLLNFFFVLSALLLRRALAELEAGRRPRLLLAGFGAAVAGALLTKGLVGVVFPGLVLLAWAAVLGRWRLVPAVILSPAPLVFLALVSPWFALMERAHPGYLRFFVLEEHFSRYASTKSRHEGPPWYPVGVFAAGLLPWSVFLPGAVRHLLTRSRETLRRHSDDVFLALWAAVVVLFFTVSRSKLATYVLPAVPPAAILVGRYLAGPGPASATPLLVNAALWTVLAPLAWMRVAKEQTAQGMEIAVPVACALAALVAGSWIAVAVRRRRPGAVAPVLGAAMAAVFLAGAVAYPEIAKRRSLHDLAVAASREGGAEVVAYDGFSYSLPWVLERPIPVAAYGGEMATDEVFPPEIFWSEERFWERWNSGKPVVVVFRSADAGEFRKPDRRAARFLVEPPAGRRGFGLAANYPATPR